VAVGIRQASLLSYFPVKGGSSPLVIIVAPKSPPSNVIQYVSEQEINHLASPTLLLVGEPPEISARSTPTPLSPQDVSSEPGEDGAPPTSPARPTPTPLSVAGPQDVSSEPGEDGAPPTSPASFTPTTPPVAERGDPLTATLPPAVSCMRSSKVEVPEDESKFANRGETTTMKKMANFEKTGNCFLCGENPWISARVHHCRSCRDSMWCQEQVRRWYQICSRCGKFNSPWNLIVGDDGVRTKRCCKTDPTKDADVGRNKSRDLGSDAGGRGGAKNPGRGRGRKSSRGGKKGGPSSRKSSTGGSHSAISGSQRPGFGCATKLLSAAPGLRMKRRPHLQDRVNVGNTPHESCLKMASRE